VSLGTTFFLVNPSPEKRPGFFQQVLVRVGGGGFFPASGARQGWKQLPGNTQGALNPFFLAQAPIDSPGRLNRNLYT